MAPAAANRPSTASTTTTSTTPSATSRLTTTPSAQELIDVAEDYTEQCIANNEDFIQFVGTNNSARDIDTIRRALGEDEISYFGFSYGSELGGVWTTLFPETVRAAVFDGAADPNADTTERLLQQVAGFEATLATFLAQCSADPDCAFHNDGDAEGAFDRLMLKIDEKPLPSVPGRPSSRGPSLSAPSAEAMYLDDLWPALEEALAAAARGDGSGLLALFDSYYRRQPDGTWDNSLEAFSVIRCMDSAVRPTIEEADAEVEQFNEVAPRFAPYTAGDYMCTFFPESTDPRIAITGAGAGPIVVCGATGDPSTPLESTRAMAETLEDGRLIIIQADQHTCYRADECADRLIDDYLVDLTSRPLSPSADGVLVSPACRFPALLTSPWVLRGVHRVRPHVGRTRERGVCHCRGGFTRSDLARIRSTLTALRGESQLRTARLPDRQR